MIRWDPNPYDIMLKQFHKRHPKLKALLFFDNPKKGDKTRWLGQTVWPEGKRIPRIRLNVNGNLGGSLDILAHELAHVVWGVEEGHGANWKREYKRIYSDWTKAMRKYYAKM